MRREQPAGERDIGEVATVRVNARVELQRRSGKLEPFRRRVSRAGG